MENFNIAFTETILDESSKYIEVNIANEELAGMFSYGNTIGLDKSTSEEVNYAKLHLYNCLPIEFKNIYTL